MLALLLLKPAMNCPFQDNPSQNNCNTDANLAGNEATRLSTTAGTLMHGVHWLEVWSVTQKCFATVKILLAKLRAARGLLMKQICTETGKQKHTLMFHRDFVANREHKSWELGNADTMRRSGCGYGKPWTSGSRRRHMFQPTHCRHRYEAFDKRHNMETDQPHGE